MMKVTFEEQVMYLIKANFLQRVAILRAFIKLGQPVPVTDKKKKCT